MKVCLPCQQKKRPWENLSIAFFYQDGIKSWLYDIKERLHLERFRELSGDLLPKKCKKYDFLVPVSSDPVQTQRRLFDSTAELAKHLGRLWSIPIMTDTFLRTPFLDSQKQLEVEMRRKVLQSSVKLSERLQDLRFERILLIDDVMTSGATLDVHAQLLKSVTKKLDVFCVARTLKSRFVGVSPGLRIDSSL